MIALLAGCQTNKLPPLTPQAFVDLQRFAGDWYVIANIPTRLERDAYNALERYEVPDGNRIATTFSFNAGGYDGPLRTYNPTGFVRDDGSNAVWGMQFLWPFKAEYLILYVDPEYRFTIVGRNKRDYVWIMARDSQISETQYQQLQQRVAEAGYDLGALRRVPHQS